MTVKEIWNNYEKPIIGSVVVIVLVILLVYFAIPQGKAYVTDIIQDMVKKQAATIDANQDTQLQTKEKEISELKEKLKVSEKKYSNLQTRVTQLEKDMYENEPPKTSSELRDRFDKLGFKPTN